MGSLPRVPFSDARFAALPWRPVGAIGFSINRAPIRPQLMIF